MWPNKNHNSTRRRDGQGFLALCIFELTIAVLVCTVACTTLAQHRSKTSDKVSKVLFAGYFLEGLGCELHPRNLPRCSLESLGSLMTDLERLNCSIVPRRLAGDISARSHSSEGSLVWSAQFHLVSHTGFLFRYDLPSPPKANGRDALPSVAWYPEPPEGTSRWNEISHHRR